MGIFSFLNKPKVVETKTFSEIPGFSFEYPVFKGWEVNKIEKIDENQYYVMLNHPQYLLKKLAPIMVVEKEPTEIKSVANMLKNPQNIPYTMQISTPMAPHLVTFYADNFKVTIKPTLDEKREKLLADKVIETFKFTNCTPEAKGLVPLKNLTGIDYIASENLLKALVGKGGEKIIENLEEKKENPDDFYVEWSPNSLSLEYDDFKNPESYNSLITFSLSHKDDFKPENCNTIGNPSGKSRNMVYDTNQNKIIKVGLWR
jgi:hypothetical protein